MRGADEWTSSLFSDVSCEARVPASHRLRRIRAVVDEAVDVLSPEFDAPYARAGRPSTPPEKLLRALLPQAFYSVRSERQPMEQLDDNLLFRWFVGLSMDTPVWGATSFSKNRERFLAGDLAQQLLTAILRRPRVRAQMSDEQFSVDGTLIQAWAELAKVPPASASGMPAEGSHKSFRPKPDADPGASAGRGAATRRTPARPIRTRHWRASRTGR